MNESKKYYIGLDIGSNSVGIACTDENYNLLRAKGRDCWAVRLFDESSTAVERRMARTARRRLARRKYRISQLQALFAPEMNDKLFFTRLQNSQYFTCDKAAELCADKNNLFADGNYTDKDFYREYPTIYHLRAALQKNCVDDLRLYYLAIHHIVKYRGHFLFEGSMQDVRDINKPLQELNYACETLYSDDVPHFDVAVADRAKQILQQKSGVKAKCQALNDIFGAQSAEKKEIIKGMCGAKVSPATLFGKQYAEEKSFSFGDINDEAFEAMRPTYDENFALLEAIRSIYNFVLFENLLAGHQNFSEAMVALYNKHKADLCLLKKVVKKFASQEEYNRLFKSLGEKANYVNYIGYTRKGGDRKNAPKCSYEDFLAYLKRFLTALPADEQIDCILADIDNKTFLPKILNADNGIVPYQVNEAELDKILAKMVERFPQMEPTAAKIKAVFLFRVPYYVGPLTGINSWVVRTKTGVPITPWNFDEIVDRAASNEQFMRRMTNKCTYLRGENVLPKASILYQKFNTLNQLNKLQVNQKPLSVSLKQKIYNQLFLVKNKVSDKMIVDLLVREGEVSEAERADVSLGGKDEEIKASMSTYIQLKKILGDFVDDDLANGGSVCENIVLWHTLNTDKTIVESLIKANYADIPIVSQNIKRLKGLTFRDFGRLSARLLVGLRSANHTTGEMQSIMDVLYETNENLNEILYDENYDFNQLIDEANGDQSTDVTYADVEELYVSPVVRRGIWQSLNMIDEYIGAFGTEPHKIFVEVTREDGVKGSAGRTVPRKKALLEKYKGIQGIEELVAELQSDNVSDLRLRQERLYLYFRQLGRCMYSGERIDLSRINTDMYDVDHILPRSYIKDDSLDNKVLVLRSKNAEKSDKYPLPQGFTTQQNFWRFLYEKQLIGDKTYKRLTRVEPLGNDDYADFINRQKVITDQTAKAVVQLLQRKYPSVKVVFSKAKNVSDFKQKFDLYKCRETNDLHHARDAYLNIVVGNVFDTCFSTPMSRFYNKGDVWKTYNLRTMFTRNVEGAWNENSLTVVKNCYQKCSMAVTRYAYCNKGAFYAQTVYSGTENVTAPRKLNGPLSNAERYGGYKTQTTAYFAIVESDGKKGRVKTIEAVPVLVDYQSRRDENRTLRYFEETLGLKNVRIIVPKLKVKQLVRYNGSLLYLAGVTGKQVAVHNAVQLFTDNKTDDYINQLIKLVDMDKKGMIDNTMTEYDVKTNRMGQVKLKVAPSANVQLYDMLTSKLDGNNYAGVSAYAAFKNNLIVCKENFVKLRTIEQARALLQILKLFKCNAETVDMTAIGGKSVCGKLLINKDITNANFEIVAISPCGLTVRTKRV